MNFTHDEAQKMQCPFARTFADQKPIKNCRGQACILWRWEKITISHPAWKSAIKAIVDETGEKAPYKDAARKVADDPLAHGLTPTRGWCGPGGSD
ncbi:MAG: hypothetical protein ACPG4X_16375 [Pikeienuella sp.]